MILKERSQRALAGLFVLLGGGLLAWWLFNAYSVRNRYQAFSGPTLEFMGAGQALDSARLARTGASASAVQWVLETGRHDPTLLRDVSSGLRALSGRRSGDTTFVLFRPTGKGKCYNLLIAVTFTGAAAAARIQEITATCAQTTE